MKPEFNVIPSVAVHPDRINIFSVVEWQPYKPKGRPREELVKQCKKTNGIISPQARRKINKAVEYLVYMAKDKKVYTNNAGKNFKFKISFITLTLSSKQIHSDNELKALFLNHFLIEARKRWNLTNYVWRAEKQTNGNLHFHILCDRFIPWSELRDVWNRIQNKLGYVDRYRKEMQAFHQGGFTVRQNLIKNWSYQNQVKAYKAGVKNDWNNPNSSDIHSIRFVRDIKAYISKYLSKNEEYQNVSGRLWGCSVKLSTIKGGQGHIDSHLAADLTQIMNDPNVKTYSGDHFTVLFVDVSYLVKNDCMELFNLFSNYLIDKFQYHAQMAIT